MPLETYLERERPVRAAFDRGELRLAATLALDEFGPDVLRFLRARLRSPVQAEDAHLQFCEDMWLGLPSFRWESSLRAWLFVLARNTATRVGRAQRREVPLSSDQGGQAELLARARSSTALFMQTAVKDRMREIRQQLDEDEQTLLILRIDRGLDWRELAIVMGEAAADASDDEKKRAAARLRTRFQAAKKKLRVLAEAAGLIRRRSDALDRSP
jgi:RNA polymerase sigma-70 factor (ECF subfamily)